MQYGLAQVVNSGNGPYIDFKFAKKAEVLAWGGYKGRLKTALIDAVGTTTINGVEVFNDVPLMGKINNKNTPEAKVLELLGIGDEDRKKIIDGYRKGVKSVVLNWDNKPAASNNRLEQELRMIRKALDGYDKIVVTQDWRKVSTANKGTLNYGYTWQQGVRGDTLECSLNKTWNNKPPSPNPDNFIWDKTDLINKYTIHLVRPDGTQDVPDIQIKEALTAIILLSRQVAFKRIHSEHHFRDDGNGYFTILTKEDYDAKLDITAVAQNIDMYARKDGASYTISEERYDDDSGKMMTLPIPIYGYHVWLSEQVDHQNPPYWFTPVHEHGMNDIDKTTNGLFIAENGKRYLTVDGLARCQPSQFIWVSSFANIEFKPKRGGFIKRWIGGLIRGITSFINTIVEVLFKVPVLALMFSSILAMLVVAGKAIGGDVELMMKSILKTIIASAMLYYAPQMLGFEAGAIGGASIAGVELGSLSGLSTLASMGISASSNFEEYKWSEEQDGYEWEEPDDTDMFAEIKELDIEGREDPNSWEQMYFLQYTGMFDVGFMFELQNTVRIPEYGRKKV